MDFVATVFLPVFGFLILIIGIPLAGFLFGLGFSFAQRLVNNPRKMNALKTRLTDVGKVITTPLPPAPVPVHEASTDETEEIDD